MSALEQEHEQEEQQQPLFQVSPNYEEWWVAQVRAVLPKWQHGSWRYGFEDGFVRWPYPKEALAARLEHLAKLKAHS